MALTPSNMLDLGTEAPDFNLTDVVNNRQVTFREAAGEKGTLLMFICQHCPYVIHIEKEIARIANDFSSQGIGVVAISSNDIEKYPQDAPDRLRAQVERAGFNFPYLFDEDQSVARAYDAACTPDFYVFDQGGKLVYRGRMDEARPGNDQPVTGKDLRAALQAVVTGNSYLEKQYPSMGCNIKWKD